MAAGAAAERGGIDADLVDGVGFAEGGHVGGLLGQPVAGTVFAGFGASLDFLLVYFVVVFLGLLVFNLED